MSYWVFNKQQLDKALGDYALEVANTGIIKQENIDSFINETTLFLESKQAQDAGMFIKAKPLSVKAASLSGGEACVENVTINEAVSHE